MGRNEHGDRCRDPFVGPLEPHAQGFADELLRQGYSPKIGIEGQLFFVRI
jgi:hypothetical protein